MNFFERFLEWVKSPEKARSSEFAELSAQLSAQAAIKRFQRHQHFQSVRRNTRGLPVGISMHDIKNASTVETLLRLRPESHGVGDTRLQAAETTIDAVKSNRKARKQIARPSKLARRLASLY